MFGFFASQEKKMRENAGNWLELGEKVYHYRRDVLLPAQVAELQSRMAELRALVKERAGPEKLKLGIERLEEVLRRTGGSIYPKTALVENVEFFLVAAIVILGIRTYFVQPFKIPTNSMWPTYNGMTPQVYKAREDEPGAPAVAARLAAFGAWPHRVDAPAEGEIVIPIGGRERRGEMYSRTVPGRSWLVLPTQLREYSILVGGREAKLRLPLDFDFDWVVYDAFLKRGDVQFSREAFAREVLARPFELGTLNGEPVRLVRTGKRVKQGERVLAFDEMTGDQLFVDRMSYHFIRPSVGSGFVFRTGHIPPIADVAGDQYYIKRLVGVPGDKLEIREPALLRNGAAITGSQAFDDNGRRANRYSGYQAIGSLGKDETVTVPPHSYFALGDNSYNSQDGRYWGFVPAKDVVGRPIFVYYPFTSRWGPAR
jgi:signal peptidase I